MKIMKVNGCEYSEYSAPSVAALNVVAEKGFAESTVDVDGNPFGDIFGGEYGGEWNEYE